MCDTKPCPICGQTIPVLVRYPDHICRTCADRAASAEGRPLEFYNETVLGGILAFYADTGKPYHPGEVHIPCFVDGVPCVAEEARFGGIVVQVVVNGSPRARH